MYNIFRELIMDNPFTKKKIVPSSYFELSISTFIDLIPMLLKSTPYSPDPTFGFTLQENDLLKITFAKNNQPKYPASNIFSNPRSTNNKPRGASTTSMYGTRVFTSADTPKQLHLLHNQGGVGILTHL